MPVDLVFSHSIVLLVHKLSLFHGNTQTVLCVNTGRGRVGFQALTGTALSTLLNQKKPPCPCSVSACSALAVVASAHPPVLRLTDGRWGPSLLSALTPNITQRAEDRRVKRALMNILKTLLMILLL